MEVALECSVELTHSTKVFFEECLNRLSSFIIEGCNFVDLLFGGVHREVVNIEVPRL